MWYGNSCDDDLSYDMSVQVLALAVLLIHRHLLIFRTAVLNIWGGYLVGIVIAVELVIHTLLI